MSYKPDQAADRSQILELNSEVAQLAKKRQAKETLVEKFYRGSW